MIDKIRRLLINKKILPLAYSEELRDAYTGTSVVGGQLVGKTVLITGGTGGIGTAMALRFLAEGCHVIISGRNENKLVNSVTYLKAKIKNASVSYVIMDQLDKESIQQVVDKLKKNDSFIDILVNNSGIFTDVDRKRRFRHVAYDEFEAVWKTNFEGTMWLTELIVQEMEKRSIHGNIVNIGSICAEIRNYKYTPYGISKAAVSEYSLLLSKKYRDIIINIIEPGSVATNMGNLRLGDNISRDSNVLHHPALPEEIAALAAFLVSDCGTYLAGKKIVASACEGL